jgi:hypothetical protein
LLKKQRAKFGGKLDGKVGTEMRKRGCCSDFGFKIFNFLKKKEKEKTLKLKWPFPRRKGPGRASSITPAYHISVGCGQ